MVHYFAAVQSPLDGFNSESPERLHIDYTKEAYRASNKRDYVKQMTVWLGRQETVARFRAYLDYVITLDPNSHAIPLDDETQLELEDNEMEEPAPTYLLPHSTHSVAIKPAFPYMDFNTLTTQFKANNLFKLFLHTFVASFLLLHFQFFPTLWIALIFTSISPSFNLQTQMLGFLCLWSVSVPHPQFQQKVDQRQYQHILILCWCVLQTLMRISIPKGLT